MRATEQLRDLTTPTTKRRVPGLGGRLQVPGRRGTVFDRTVGGGARQGKAKNGVAARRVRGGGKEGGRVAYRHTNRHIDTNTNSDEILAPYGGKHRSARRLLLSAHALLNLARDTSCTGRAAGGGPPSRPPAPIAMGSARGRQSAASPCGTRPAGRSDDLDGRGDTRREAHSNIDKSCAAHIMAQLAWLRARAESCGWERALTRPELERFTQKAVTSGRNNFACVLVQKRDQAQTRPFARLSCVCLALLCGSCVLAVTLPSIERARGEIGSVPAHAFPRREKENEKEKEG